MEEIISGIHSVEEMLMYASQFINWIAIEKRKYDKRLQNIQNIAKEKGINVFFVSDENKKNKIFQGVSAEIKRFQYSDFNKLKKIDGIKERLPIILLLDCIQDPHNLGAIIRSARFFNIHGVVLCKDRAVHINSTVIRTSAGAVAGCNVSIIVNLARAIEELKKEGWFIIGSVIGDYPPPYRIDFKFPAGIVVGSEGKGLRRLVCEKCDVLTSISSPSKFDSLNVGSFTTIFLYELFKKSKIQE